MLLCIYKHQMHKYWFSAIHCQVNFLSAHFLLVNLLSPFKCTYAKFSFKRKICHMPVVAEKQQIREC